MTTLLVLLVLAGAVGVLTAAATSVRSVSRIWLRHWVEQRLGGVGGADPALERPQRWLSAAAIGVSAIVFGTGASIGLRASGVRAAEQLAAALALLVVAGQLIPRAVARRWATALAPVLMPVLGVIAWVCAPLVAVAARLAPSAPAPAGGNHPPRDTLEDLLREGELEGVGEASESAIISGVVEFGDKLALQVMTRRDDVLAVERSTSPEVIARIVAQSAYSRIPVYEGDLDHVVGLVHSFDVLADPGHPVRSLRRVARVRASTPCHDVMRSMLRDRVHLAVVQGARGETLGIVTLEDLVEELVGDISDEHDDPRSVIT